MKRLRANGARGWPDVRSPTAFRDRYCTGYMARLGGEIRFVAKGGKNTIGPNLWDIVNRAPGAVDGFKYSKVMAGMSDKSWNYENLNAFLLKPRNYANGTKMTFAGLKRDSDRVNVIAYLRSLSDNPAPLN